MSQDVIKTMLKLIREAIAHVQTSADNEPDRALTRVMAHLWSAHDEVELCARVANAAGA